MRQDEPNKCLICALWRLGSWFSEAANEATFDSVSNECSTLYSILLIRTRQINQNMKSTPKQMANAFSLKYRLETDSVCFASAYSASDRTQLAASLWYVHICMLAGICLASFKCGRGLTRWMPIKRLFVHMGHLFGLASVPHASFTFAYRCRLDSRLKVGVGRSFGIPPLFLSLSCCEYSGILPAAQSNHSIRLRGREPLAWCILIYCYGFVRLNVGLILVPYSTSHSDTTTVKFLIYEN